LYYIVINYARIHSVSIFSFSLCIARYFAVTGLNSYYSNAESRCNWVSRVTHKARKLDRLFACGDIRPIDRSKSNTVMDVVAMLILRL